MLKPKDISADALLFTACALLVTGCLLLIAGVANASDGNSMNPSSQTEFQLR
jgi:hypothetical protein